MTQKIVHFDFYNGTTRVRILFAEWKDAPQRVEVPILLAAKLYKKSKRGAPFECLLAVATMQAAADDPTLFPHPVLYVHVLPSVLYIVTKLATTPREFDQAVRYQHNFTGPLRKFDTYTYRHFMQEFNGKTVVVRLSPVRRHGRPGVPGVHPTTRAATSTVTISRGALRRAQDAHLVP